MKEAPLNLTRLIALCLIFQWGALSAKLVYPETPKIDHVDEYNGVLVADPYRWMEEMNSDSTKKWVAAEKALTENYFNETPLKGEMLKRLEEVDRYDSVSLPLIRNHKWFWVKRTSNFSEVLCVRDDFLFDSRVLIDPREFSADGSVRLFSYSPSPDGKWVAYCTNVGGSDWRTAKIRNAETGEDLEDVVEWIKFASLVWDPKSAGFFYGRFDAPPSGEELRAPNYVYKIYFHKRGTSQEEDVLIYENSEDIRYRSYLHSVVEQRYLGMELFDTRTWRVIGFLYKDLAEPDSPVKKEVIDPSANLSFVGKVGEEIFLLTDKDAPRGRILALAPHKGRTVIPETSAVLNCAYVVGDRIVCKYLRNGCPEICLFSLEGRLLSEVKLPKKICSIEGMRPYPEKREVWFTISSPETPDEIYCLNVDRGVLEPIFEPLCSWSADEFETDQVFYRAKDGAPLVLFISHKKGLVLDGKNPTILYGYGRYGNTTPPYFLPPRRIWLEKGGVYCIAAIRGGGEYGRDPNTPGAQVTQESVDDFLSAAEWLIEHHYTSKEHLGILGGSYGGWLVATCMNQRPDLFGAVVAGNGVLDLLRAPCYTIAWSWFSYGECWDPSMFSLNYPFSPYHNVQKGVRYPAALFSVGNRDDRVVPCHSYKQVAMLQEAQAENAPILLHVEPNQGHAWTSANSWNSWAAILTFFYRNLAE